MKFMLFKCFALRISCANDAATCRLQFECHLELCRLLVLDGVFHVNFGTTEGNVLNLAKYTFILLLLIHMPTF